MNSTRPLKVSYVCKVGPSYFLIVNAAAIFYKVINTQAPDYTYALRQNEMIRLGHFFHCFMDQFWCSLYSTCCPQRTRVNMSTLTHQWICSPLCIKLQWTGSFVSPSLHLQYSLLFENLVFSDTCQLWTMLHFVSFGFHTCHWALRSHDCVTRSPVFVPCT